MKIFHTSVLIFFLTLNYTYSQSTRASYTQGKNYKAVQLVGYGTDSAGGYDKPILVLNRFDSGSTNLYLTNAFAFSKDENLKAYIIFPNEKKDKKWEITNVSFGCKDEDYDNAYDCLFLYEFKSVTSGKSLKGAEEISNKLMKSKEVVITLTDDLTSAGEDNVIRFKTKTHKNKIEKVLSSKHFSKDQELLN